MIRDWKKDQVIHINADDPELELFRELDERGIIQLRVLPNVSMEATAKFVAEHVGEMIRKDTGGRVYIHALECRENEKNSGWYYPQGGELLPQSTAPDEG